MTPEHQADGIRRSAHPILVVGERRLWSATRTSRSHALQWLMRCRLPLDDDGIASPHIAANQHDAHNPGFPDEVPSAVAIKYRGKKTLAMGFNLCAWIAQARDFNLRCLAYP